MNTYNKTRNMTILVLAAHPDDEILGVGGTLAKYSKDKEKIVTAVFSMGEMSPPWIKPEILTETRKIESEKAHKLVGVNESYFLELTDANFAKDAKKEKVDEKMMRIIKKHKPNKIFTHSPDDPHPHHRLVYALTMKVLKKMKFDTNVYVYDVWNPLSLLNRNKPKMYIDVTKTFKKKIKALGVFKSQKAVMAQLLPGIYVRAITNGLSYGCKYAERFTKVK